MVETPLVSVARGEGPSVRARLHIARGGRHQVEATAADGTAESDARGNGRHDLASCEMTVPRARTTRRQPAVPDRSVREPYRVSA